MHITAVHIKPLTTEKRILKSYGQVHQLFLLSNAQDSFSL